MLLSETAVWAGKIFVDGWTAGGGGAHDVVEPATGARIALCGTASVDDVVRASGSAAVAQRSWAALPPGRRAAVLRRAGSIIEENAAEIAQWIVRESGSASAKAEYETGAAAAECFDSAGLPSHPAGEVLTSNEDRWSFARRRPAGVVSVIAPFNVPLLLAMRSVAPALALGNSVLLKPDPRTTVCGGVVLQRVFEEAGLPAGTLQLLPGGADVGAAVVEAPEVRIVSFTGSTPAGRKIGEAAARLLKRAHLELGGNNALVVLPGADVEKAASAGAFGSFNHQGQICMSTGRHIVHESVYEEYVEALVGKAKNLSVGDPATAPVALGPIIDENQLARIDGIVRRAERAGGRIATGGTFEGLFYAPTVIADVTRDNPAWCDETFGPVAPVLKFSSLDEAVDLVNGSEYGLAVGIIGNVGDAMTLADRIDSGKIHINEQTVNDESNAPFGGTRASGNGSRFGGAGANIEAFTETQWLTVRPTTAPYPF
ncbi:benzaldehyde dehydrogenase [Streptomyces sp. SID10853]|uniref:benzaldehyde dehydrogenase n=1 Tax=Streptomyces sp. SID10853 TaxID=2706028 RepID=UPI0013C0FFBC|nr:benzaldehyde dehydrogenase [Streptomyces sp. SID10853]NDZ80932.1 benzaldehyde dehydrogenase [Streptomyces sp. SID10853]